MPSEQDYDLARCVPTVNTYTSFSVKGLLRKRNFNAVLKVQEDVKKRARWLRKEDTKAKEKAKAAKATETTALAAKEEAEKQAKLASESRFLRELKEKRKEMGQDFVQKKQICKENEYFLANSSSLQLTQDEIEKLQASTISRKKRIAKQTRYIASVD